MASGVGVCAGEAQIENRSMLAMINVRLGMGSSNDGSRDDTWKLSLPQQADSRIQASNETHSILVAGGSFACACIDNCPA